VLSSQKTLLNLLFLAAAGGGFIGIFGDTALSLRGELLAIVGLIVVYGLLVSAMLRGCRDRSLAEHHLDAIYFLGFIFTLAALVALFMRVTGGSFEAQGEVLSEEVLGTALHYIGISVTSSLAGILMRNLARGHYLKTHPEEDDTLAETYALLHRTVAQFSEASRQSFEKLDLFLAERSETMSSMTEKEQRYLAGLEAFTEATERFAGGLTRSEAELSARVADLRNSVDGYQRYLSRFAEVTDTLARSSDAARERMDALPIEAAGAELERFRSGVQDLNKVLDSLIELLERKVQRVG
jgi:hypothetical protein